MTTDSSESGGRAVRRKLPFGRAAVLVVGERSHIVGVDVSVTGAYLSTRAPLRVGDTHLLKLLIVPDRVQIEILIDQAHAMPLIELLRADLSSPDIAWWLSPVIASGDFS